MKKTILALTALAAIASQQNAHGSEGVIMGGVRAKLASIRVSPEATDENATVHARFSFAMGMLSTERRVAVSSFAVANDGDFHFKKVLDAKDKPVNQACSVTYAELASAKFNPVCH